jgi:hypothetical protein
MTFSRKTAVIVLSIGGAFLVPAVFGNGWNIGLSPKYWDLQIGAAVLGVIYLILGWSWWRADSGEGADRKPGEEASF